MTINVSNIFLGKFSGENFTANFSVSYTKVYNLSSFKIWALIKSKELRGVGRQEEILEGSVKQLAL